MPYVFEAEKREGIDLKTGFYPVTITEIKNPEPNMYGEQLYLSVHIDDTGLDVKKWLKTEFKWKISRLISSFKMDATVTESEVDGKTVETYSIDFTKQVGKKALALAFINAKGFVDIFDFIEADASESMKNSMMARFIEYRDNGFRFKAKSSKPTTPKPSVSSDEPPF